MSEINFKAVELTKDAIQNLNSEWIELANSSIENNLFLSPWYAQASLNLFKDKNPFIVLIEFNNQLIGLAIFHSDIGYAKIPVGFFRTCSHYHQFLGTPLIRKGCAEEFFIGVSKWLDASPANKSFCILELLSGNEEILNAANQVFKSQNRSVAILEKYDRAAIIGPPLDGAASDAHLSKSRIKSLKRRRSNLLKLGEVSIERFSDRDDPTQWLDSFVRLENSGWKREQKTSIAENPIDYEFYRELVELAAAEHSLSFLRLDVDGVPIAYTLDLKQDNFVYCVKCAHDENFRKYAPGVILEFELLQDYYRNDLSYHVDSCTSPTNDMLNELWPHKKNITSIAFSKLGLHHDVVFNGTMFLKNRISKDDRGSQEKHDD